MEGATPKRNRWDLTPGSQAKADSVSGSDSSTPSRFSQSKGFGETPTPGRWSQPTPMRMNMETPTPGGASRFGATPTGNSATRWDQKPGQTPVGGGFMTTPMQGMHPMMTPTPG